MKKKMTIPQVGLGLEVQDSGLGPKKTVWARPGLQICVYPYLQLCSEAFPGVYDFYCHN